MTFVDFTDAACECSPQRAAGAADLYNAVRSNVCGQAVTPDAVRMLRDVLRNVDGVHDLSRLVVNGWNELRANAGFAAALMPTVTYSQVRALFDGGIAAMSLCDGYRAAGNQSDILRALATSIDVVANPAVSGALYAVSAGVGASGLLAKAVGVTVTAWIGGAMGALVALIDILAVAGVPQLARDAARQLDEGEAQALAAASTTTKTATVLANMGTFVLPSEVPQKKSNPPPPPSSSGSGGAVIAIGGASLFGLFLLTRRR